jgi:transglutaminase-like putative cysteine protease
VARISIVHSTEYAYRNAVGLTRHRVMLRPDDSHDLRLHHAALDVDPKPSLVHWTHDAFDNSICFLEWPESLRTDRLSIVSTLDLTHHPDGPPAPGYSLDPGAEAFPFAYASEEIPDLANLAKRQEPDPDGSVDAWARRFVGDKAEARTLAVLEAMTHAIKAEFRYEARHEEGTQTATKTIALRSGTCRDFAVLMMEALRSFGVATRFVTGYLYDDTSGTTRGGAARMRGATSICRERDGWNMIRRTDWPPGPTSFALGSLDPLRRRCRSQGDMSALPMIRQGLKWTSQSPPCPSESAR